MARIYEKDIPKVIDAMQQLLAATSSPIPNTGLAEDEINLLREHRRQKQLTLLKNCGIDIAAAPAAEPGA